MLLSYPVIQELIPYSKVTIVQETNRLDHFSSLYDYTEIITYVTALSFATRNSIILRNPVTTGTLEPTLAITYRVPLIPTLDKLPMYDLMERLRGSLSLRGE